METDIIDLRDGQFALEVSDGSCNCSFFINKHELQRLGNQIESEMMEP